MQLDFFRIPVFQARHELFLSIMMDVVEVPDGTFLLLRPCIHGMLLQHLGSGAEVIIEAPCTLRVENGNGFLTRVFLKL